MHPSRPEGGTASIRGSAAIIRAPKDHINIRILQNTISGIPPCIGPGSQNVRSLCLRPLITSLAFIITFRFGEFLVRRRGIKTMIDMLASCHQLVLDLCLMAMYLHPRPSRFFLTQRCLGMLRLLEGSLFQNHQVSTITASRPSTVHELALKLPINRQKQQILRPLGALSPECPHALQL